MENENNQNSDLEISEALEESVTGEVIQPEEEAVEEIVEAEIIENEPEQKEELQEEIVQSESELQPEQPRQTYQFQQPYMNEQYIPNKKKSGNAWKIALGIIGGSVLAAFIFFGCVRTLNWILPQTNQIAKVDTSENQIQQTPGLSTVSGAAISQVSDVSGVVENVMPAIVSITQNYTAKGYSMFGQYYENNATGSGSGFIVSQDENELLIVTNNHVVQDANKIQVKFIDDEMVEATVKGTDSTADLAVLSIKMSKLSDSTKKAIKVATLGDSAEVKVGQMAIAIGNALGYGQSVTVGYISAKDREVKVTDEDTGKENTMVLLQTDAAINPGNSGGALLDLNGNVVGINSVKYASSEVEGMGYAIPISKAVPIINELMKREVLNDDEKGYLGITGRNISSDISKAYGIPEGVYVSEVGKNGSAKAAGIKVGDVIVKINDAEVKTITEVQERVNSYRVGTQLTITIKRSTDGEYKEKELKVKLKGSSTLNDLDISNDKEETPKNEQDESYDQTVPWGGSLY